MIALIAIIALLPPASVGLLVFWHVARQQPAQQSQVDLVCDDPRGAVHRAVPLAHPRRNGQSTVIRILAAVALLLLALLALQALHIERLKGQIATMERNAAIERADAAEQARAIEQAIVIAVGQIAAAFEQEVKDAQVKADAVVADLTAGNIRLRKEWQGCETMRAGDSAAAAAELDAANELRAAGVRNLVRIGAECDAHVRGLQRAYGVIAE